MSGRPQAVLRSKELLRELMKDRHDTVTLAEATGLSKQVIGYLWSTNGRQSCSLRTARLIADALGVHLGTLFSLPVSSSSPDKEGQ